MKKTVILLLSSLSLASAAQVADSSTTFPFKPVSVISFSHLEAELSHDPTKEDEERCRKLKHLIQAKPTQNTHEDYYKLAVSLWELSRLDEAERLFTEIANSAEEFYGAGKASAEEETRWGPDHNFYKHHAQRYLAQIWMERKNFEKGLQHLRIAEYVHEPKHSCGTTYWFYRREMDGLFSICFDALNMYDSTIHLYLHNFFYLNDGSRLVNALQHRYTAAQIKDSLLAAERSLVCGMDTFETATDEVDENGQPQQASAVLSPHAHFILFGYYVQLPFAHFYDSALPTREDFIAHFRATYFYQKLSGEE